MVGTVPIRSHRPVRSCVYRPTTQGILGLAIRDGFPHTALYMQTRSSQPADPKTRPRELTLVIGGVDLHPLRTYLESSYGNVYDLHEWTGFLKGAVVDYFFELPAGLHDALLHEI